MESNTDNKPCQMSFRDYMEINFDWDLRKWFEGEHFSNPYDYVFVGFPENRKENQQEISDMLRFVTGVYFGHLTAMAIAKATDSTDAAAAFSSLTGFPLISCGMLGFVDPLTTLKDSQLFPDQSYSLKEEILNDGFYFIDRLEKIFSEKENIPTAQADLQNFVKGKEFDIIKLILDYNRQFIDYIECPPFGDPEFEKTRWFL